MISRKSARLIAELFEATFRKYHSGGSHSSGYYTVNTTALYDFLFDNEHAGYFCNAARKTYSARGTRELKDFLMKLHTGESLYTATQDWTWEQREKLGLRYLHDLAEDILNHWATIPDEVGGYRPNYSTQRALVATLQKQLELDGYEYKNGRILDSETDILDVAEEAGVLRTLHAELNLPNKETAFHHLDLTEEHYIAERWDDSISNSRKFLESVLQEIAATHSEKVRNESLAQGTYSRPVRVRDYLEHEGLLEPKEKEALSAIYGLLSNTGGHPYMAQREQARLLRHLALTLAQFAMLRLRGSLKAS